MIVVTWNVENLFRPGGDSGPRDASSYRAKLEALAATIGDLNPDVLALQEVGQPEALADLVDELGSGWTSAVSEFPDGRGIRVALLARSQLSAIEQIRGFPHPLAGIQATDDGATSAEMGRGALKARASVDGWKVDLVTCHLKSKLLSFPGGRFSPRDEGERARVGAYALYRRAAEAVTVRAAATELLDGQGQQRAVIVLGDLNDEPLAATTQILVGPPGSELGTRGFDSPDQGDGQRLWNLARLIPEQRRFSRVFRGRGELIDHILVSHALATAVDRVDAPTQALPSVTTTPSDRRDEPASDHSPIVAEFTQPAR